MPRKTVLSVLFFLIFLSTANEVFGFGQDNIAMHGFASQGYLISSDNNYLGNSSDGSFEYNEIGINFSVAINDDLRFGVQFFSRDLGSYGNNELTVDWAFLDYTWRDWLGFRAGKIKMPFGLYNRQRDADMLRTSILLPHSVYTEGLRSLVMAIYGFSLYGTKNLGAFGYIDYEFFGGTSDIESNASWMTESLELTKYTDPVTYNTIQSLLSSSGIRMSVTHSEGGMLIWNTPITGLRLGVTDLMINMRLTTPVSETDTKMDGIYVFSAEYDIGDFNFVAEHKTVDMENSSSSTGGLESEGYYGAISWDIIKMLTIGLAYGEYYPNSKDKNGSEIQKMPANPPANYEGPLKDYYAWQKDITTSVRFNVNEYWCFKFEVHFNDGLGLATVAANPPQESEQNWILYLFKTSLSF